MKHGLVTCALLALCLGALALTASGQEQRAAPFVAVEEARLTASDGTIGDGLGRSVSIFGNTAVVGTPGDDHAGQGSGSAYVFVRNGTSWTQQAKLTASDATLGAEFGHSVSLSGDTVIVGAWRDNEKGFKSGAAYVFVRNGTTWNQQVKLRALDGAPNDHFGGSVSVSGGTAVIGASLDDTTLSDSGSAYVFVRKGSHWGQQVKLRSPDADSDDRFGFSVSLSFDTVIVGAPHDDATGPDSGAAYVFRQTGTGWTQQGMLTAGDTSAGDGFGYAVAISGASAVVGAFGHDHMAQQAGAAYVFVRNGASWAEQTELRAMDGMVSDFVGTSVAIFGGTAVVSAIGADGTFPNPGGAAYVYRRSGTSWSDAIKLTASDASSDGFGDAVSVFDDRVLVGAPGGDGVFFGQGATIVYRLAADPWSDLGNGLAGTHGVPALAGTGALVAGDPTGLELAGALENTSATLIIGLDLLGAPFKGGVMVPKLDVVLPGLPTGAAGELVLSSTWPAGIPPGLVTYFQHWITDPAGPAGFSASNAVSGTSQ